MFSNNTASEIYVIIMFNLTFVAVNILWLADKVPLDSYLFISLVYWLGWITISNKPR